MADQNNAIEKLEALVKGMPQLTLEDCEAFCAGAVIVEPEVTDGSN